MLLKRKIPIAMISLVSIPLIFLSVIVYIYTSSALIESSKNRIRNICEIEGEYVSSIISAQKRELYLIAGMEELKQVLEAYKIDSRNDRSLELSRDVYWTLKNTLQSSPGLENIFIADAQGNVIINANSDTADLNVSDQLYFKRAIQGGTEMSNIIQVGASQENLVVMAMPIRGSATEITGVLCNSIKLEYFKDKITDIKMSNGGYAYIVDAKGIIVAHPEVSKVGTPIQNDVVNHIVRMIDSNETIFDGEGTYTYQGQEKYMAYSVIKDLNWIMVFSQNKLEMNKPARIVLGLIIITTLGFMSLTIFTSIQFSKSITQPITQLIGAMDKASAGDLSLSCDVQSKDEFGHLARNFNSMIYQLNGSYEELTAVYEELAATEEELREKYEELQISAEYLRNSEEKYKLALDGANDVIWEWDHKKKIFHVSDKWNDLTGQTGVTQFSLKYFLNFVHSEDIERVKDNIKEHVGGGTECYKSEFRIHLGDKNDKWLLSRGKALRNSNGELIKIAGSMTDISERKTTEDKISYMAYYDILTKLPNRILFMEKLKTTLERAKKESVAGAVMFIDLDNFKNINDTLGHDYGDRLLEFLAVKFKKVIKGPNTVCRFGGDEFLVLMPHIKNVHEVANFANVILSIFEKPFFINEKLIYITASIGISIFCNDGDSTGTLLKNADTAMYMAKALGKNRYSFFTNDMYQGLERKIQIEAILRQALIDQSFELYYQPQIEVRTTKISSFEALLRLNTKELGAISPTEFIPIAEECGLIREIGEWCLKEACLQNKKWRDAGYKFDYIAVNISPIQFQQSNFKEVILHTLKETNVKPEFLEIEITESVLMESLEKNIETLQVLKQLGVRIALDDFGTGYSSFNYLRRLPINTLKIDKSFIDGICLNRQEQAVTHGIIQLAHQMSLEVVAEGVEGQDQLAVLRAKECDKVQGYLFSKPLPVTQIEEMMKDHKQNTYKQKKL